MFRFKLLLVLLCLSVVSYGQDFLNNEDYLYAKGMGATQEEADNAALVSFSKTLQSRITSRTEYAISEENGDITRSFSKNISIDNSMVGKNIEQYVEFENGIYTVYRFINKKKYLNDRLTIYNAYLSKAEEYKQCNSSHKINFVLGAYYMAYDTIDDVIMDVLNCDNNAMKNNIFMEAKKTYTFFCRLETVENRRNFIKCNTGKPLYGFQYLTRYGEWRYPESYFKDENFLVTMSNSPKDEEYRCCMIRNSGAVSIFRKTYEIPLPNNGIGFINVPENWYF